MKRILVLFFAIFASCIIDKSVKCAQLQNVNQSSMMHSNVELFQFIYSKNLKLIKELLDKFKESEYEKKINFITAPRGDGATPLFIAVETNQLEVVRLLLDQFKAEDYARKIVFIDTNREDRTTPLLMASMLGHREIVRFLLGQFDAHKNINFLQRSPLHLQRANHLGITPLHAASYKGYTEVAIMLLQQFVNRRHRILYVQGVNNAGETPLYSACESGHPEIVQLLLDQFLDSKEKIAYINKARNDRVMPLFIAAFNGHVDVVKLLLLHKADDSVLFNNQTPLMIAKKQEEALIKKEEVLIKEIEDMQKPDRNEDTSLKKQELEQIQDLQKRYAKIITLLNSFKKAHNALTDFVLLKNLKQLYHQFNQGNEKPLYDWFFVHDYSDKMKDIANHFKFENFASLLVYLSNSDADVDKAKKILAEVVGTISNNSKITNDDSCIICLEEYKNSNNKKFIPFACCNGHMCTDCAIDTAGRLLSEKCLHCRQAFMTKLDYKYKPQQVSKIQAALRQKKSQQIVEEKIAQKV